MRVVLPLVVVGGRAAVVPREPGGPVVVGDLATVVRRAAELEVQRHPRWLVASAAEALRPGPRSRGIISSAAARSETNR